MSTTPTIETLSATQTSKCNWVVKKPLEKNLSSTVIALMEFKQGACNVLLLISFMDI